MLEAPSFYGTADAHTRRVTLNLVRASTVCPDDLVCIVDSLSDSGWDWGRLSPRDAEAIYGLLTDDLVQAAKAEFAADTRTVIDVERHRADAHDFIDNDGDTFCPLCGHKHIRWGFTLRNTVKHDTGCETGDDLLTGSSCVVQYGLRVDAETTAEAALAALNKAIGRLQRAAERDDWRAAHPNHAEDMQLLERAESFVGKTWMNQIPVSVRRSLPHPWGSYRSDSHKKWASWARAALKYYRSHGYLAETRAEQYDNGGLGTARLIVAQVEEAMTASPVVRYWQDWQAAHPGLTPREAELVRGIVAQGYERHRLTSWNLRVIEQIEARFKNLPPPPSLPDRPAKTSRVVMVDDVSDLPGMI